jgi:outer membrane protein assembly factor BamB
MKNTFSTYKTSHPALLALLLCLFTLGASAADWPTYRMDNNRGGVSPEALQLPLHQSWSHHPAQPPRPAWPEAPAGQDYWHHVARLSPTHTFDRAYDVVVSGSRLFYCSSADDTLYCLDAESGKALWDYTTEGPLRLAPSVANGRVYVGSDDGYVYCLSIKDGKLLWKHLGGPSDRRMPGNGRIISRWPVRSGVVVDSTTAYFTAGLFPNQGVYLCALNALDGSPIWKKKINATSQGYMLASPTRLFVPTGRTSPVMFNRATGKALGGFGGLGGCFAIVLEDILINGPSEKGRISISSPTTSERIASARALKLVASGDMIYILNENSLRALDRRSYIDISKQISVIKKTKKSKRSIEQNLQLAKLAKKRSACLKWSVPCLCPYEMIMSASAIITGGQDRVVAYNATNGEVIWEKKAKGKAYGLAVGNGKLFVSTNKGLIHCFKSGQTQPVAKRIHARKEVAVPYPTDEKTAQYRKAAQYILEESRIDKGYCLVLDADVGRLAYELAQRSELQIIGLEEDAKKVATARAALREAGIYGKQVAIHQGTPGDISYQKYFANLVVLDSGLIEGKPHLLPPEINDLPRPCGGTIMLGMPSIAFKKRDMDKWISTCSLPSQVSEKDGIIWGSARRGPLAGAGEWTHYCADAGNTACSGDQLTYGGMELQWFGRPGPMYMIDRHHRNTTPLYKDGRVFIPGDSVVFAVDAYNGTILWRASIPNSRRLAIVLDCGSMAVDAKHLYVVYGDKCAAYDVKTGEQRQMHQVPQLPDNAPRDWGYIAVSNGSLLGSGRKPQASYMETSWAADKSMWYNNMKVVSSDFLFGIDLNSGGKTWTYKKGQILNTTIAVGGGKIFFIETSNPKAMANPLGRMTIPEFFSSGAHYLTALDIKSGEVAYRQEIDASNFEQPVYLSYSEDILLLSGSKATGKKLRYYYYAFNAGAGEPVWKALHDTNLDENGAHGEQNRHPTIIGDTVYAWPYAYEFKTGKKIADWKFERRGHGCGNISASAHSMFWRGDNPWMYDLKQDKVSRLTTITRLGCWINVIPAGGLVLIPEASSGCTCSYPMQTSMAFLPTREQ